MKKEKKKKVVGKVFIAFCVLVAFILMSGIGNFFGNKYDSSLYISKDFIMERTGEGEYVFSGEIVNESSETIEVQHIIVVAYESGKLMDAYYTWCSFEDIELGDRDTILLHKKTYMKDYQTTDEKLFPNGSTSASISTVVCKLENGMEYNLKSHEAIEDDKENAMRVIIMGLMGAGILLFIYIVKRVRISKNQNMDI